MMETKLSTRSERNLVGVHPRLVDVVREAYELLVTGNTSLGFIVTEGVRTFARQQQLFAAGATRTLNSRHLTGHAVDLAATVNGQVRWDWPLYKQLAEVMKSAAKDLDVPLQWGGDWQSFKDGPHFQVPKDLK